MFGRKAHSPWPLKHLVPSTNADFNGGNSSPIPISNLLNCLTNGTIEVVEFLESWTNAAVLDTVKLDRLEVTLKGLKI